MVPILKSFKKNTIKHCIQQLQNIWFPNAHSTFIVKYIKTFLWLSSKIEILLQQQYY